MKIIKHNKLREMLKVHYEAKMPLFIAGGFGIGKSDVVKQTAIEIAKAKNKQFLNWNKMTNEERRELAKNPKDKFVLVDIRLSDREPTDIKGLPDLSTNTENVEWKVELWVKAIANKEFDGIVFFDEMNNAPPSVLKSAYQIFLDRQVGEYSINDNVLLLGAGNRIEDKADIFDVPLPLRDRYNEVELRTDDEVWVEWAIKEQINGMVISFIKFKPDRLLCVDNDRVGKSTTPRGWARVNEIMKHLKISDKPTQEELDECEDYVSATIGEGTATEFIAYIKLQRNIDLQQILKNPKLAEDIKQVDLRYALIGGLTEVYRKDKAKYISGVTDVCKYLEPEFVTLMLRMMKSIDTGFFMKNITQQQTWKSYLKPKFEKYLLGN